MRHDEGSDDLMHAAATRLARVNGTLIGWVIVAVALAIAAAVFTSRPAAVSSQTGPALTRPTPTPTPMPTPASTPAPPSGGIDRIEISIDPFTGETAIFSKSSATVRILDVSTLESSPSRRRLPRTIPTAAEQFIAATSGGQPIVSMQISVGATGGGTLPKSLTRAQLARVCFPAAMKPPGVGLQDLIVDPGQRLAAHLVGQTVCVDFVLPEVGTFVVGARTKAVIPEFREFYASTGGETTWGPCLTHGFFVTVGPAGTIVEAPEGTGLYIQACANGVLGYYAELAGTGYEIQPVLAPHWVRGEDGQFVEPDPPAPNTAVGQYFPATGHNVSGAFLTMFQALGGVEVLGYPITEALAAAPGFTDQYFQHLKLRMDDATGAVTIRPVGREFITTLAANSQAGPEVP